MSTVSVLKPRAAAEGSAALGTNPLVEWLLTEGWNISEPTDLVRRLGSQMGVLGIPVCRLRVTLRTLHPQYLGTTYTWYRGKDEVEEFLPTYAILQEDRFLKSPFAVIFEGAGGIRRRLDVPGLALDFPILEELRAEGATDYVAMPLVFSDGRINAITFASDRPGGFTANELGTIYVMLDVLARLFEVHALRRTARTVLETYLGRVAGERVLNGQIKRGDGEEIHAVIWFSDMRGSTRLADRMPRPAYLSLLNEFFECMAGAVLEHGGEVLRYLGDAVIAIFPIGGITDKPERCPEHIGACARAFSAARDAMNRLATVNDHRRQRGETPLGYGIALHLGDVLYGNIGVPERLDFTVIGAAANEASRIEAMCKTLEKPILISAEIARVTREKLVALGSHALRGVREPVELYTLPEL